VNSILYHRECFKSLKILWYRKLGCHIGQPILYQLSLLLNHWYSPVEQPLIYTQCSLAYSWWFAELKKVFPTLLTALPKELICLVIAAGWDANSDVTGWNSLYRSKLFRYVAVSHVIDFYMWWKRMQKERERPGAPNDMGSRCFHFLGNEYISSGQEDGIDGPVGVDHFGVRASPKGCQWLLHGNSGVELSSEVRMNLSIGREVRLLTLYSSTHFFAQTRCVGLIFGIYRRYLTVNANTLH
jgi:hypothetical protein